MKRIFWLDVTRALAIIVVVLIHCYERAGVHSPIAKSVFEIIGRQGVPLFFMISGGLVLPKLEHRSIGSFYRKRIPQFFILLFLWTVATNIVKNLLDGKGLWQSVLLAFTTTNGIYPAKNGAAIQMWFMYAIIMLYLMAPFIARLLQHLSNMEALLFLLLCVLFNEFKNTLNILGGGVDILGRLGTDFTGPYLAFFVLGYLIIDRSLFYGKSVLYCIGYILTAFLPSLLLMHIELTNPTAGIKLLKLYGQSVLLLISSAGLLLLIKWLFLNTDGESKWGKAVTTVSLCAFGIYLVHYLFIYVAMDVFKPLLGHLTDIQKVWLYFAVAFAAGFSLTYWMRKSRFSRYLVA